MGESGGSAAGPGWYTDPAGRFEFRYHNGTTWTSDVASNGQRYIDPMSQGGPLAPGGGATVQRTAPPGSNGIAVAAMVCGIVSIVVGWLPVLFAAGAVLAVLGIVFGIVGVRRARTTGRRRGVAIAGLATGSAGVLVAGLGLVFTIVVLRAVDRYENPPPSTSSIRSCVVEDGRARAAGELHNLDDRSSRFTLTITFRAIPSGTSIERTVELASTAPDATTQFAVEQPIDAERVECAIADVNGPLPFGLEID